MKSGALIYILDDDAFARHAAGLMLRKALYEVEEFAVPETALEAVHRRPPDLFLTDLFMENMDGFAVIERLKRTGSMVPVVMVTGSSNLSDAMRAMRGGAADYVTKPFSAESLYEVVARTLKIASLERETRRYVDELASRDRKMSAELALAATIQRALLPRDAPQLENFEIASTFHPSGEIGGDLFDYIHVAGTEQAGVLLADISGHGVPAALLCAMFKALAGEVGRSNRTPAEIVSDIHLLVTRHFPEGHFACTYYALLDSRTRTVTFAGGGMEPAVIVRASTEVCIMEGGAPPLGAFDPEIFGASTYENRSVRIDPGDLLLFFTDGWTEARSPKGDIVGFTRFLSYVKEAAAKAGSADDFLARLRARTVAFAGTENFQDDLTAVAVRGR